MPKKKPLRRGLRGRLRPWSCTGRGERTRGPNPTLTTAAASSLRYCTTPRASESGDAIPMRSNAGGSRGGCGSGGATGAQPLDGEKDEEDRDGAGDGVEILLVAAGAVGLVSRRLVGLQQTCDGVIAMAGGRRSHGGGHEANLWSRSGGRTPMCTWTILPPSTSTVLGVAMTRKARARSRFSEASITNTSRFFLDSSRRRGVR